MDWKQKEQLHFSKELGPSDDMLDKIIDFAHRNPYGCSFNGHITITQVEQHDAHGLNQTIHGSVFIGSKTYDFEIDNGNWNGTVVRKWEKISDEVFE